MRQAKVLRIHPDKNGNKFQVMSGFRIVGFSQGVGCHIDAFGWRLRVSIRPERQFIKPHWYNYHIRWTGYDPPWDYMSVHFAIFRITFGPAYGGHLA